MVTRIPRHDFPTDNAAETMAPIVKADEEVLDDLETSEFDRFDALGHTLTAAKWYCLTDPLATEFPTWEAWVTAMQVGSALFRSRSSPSTFPRLFCSAAGSASSPPEPGPLQSQASRRYRPASWPLAPLRDCPGSVPLPDPGCTADLSMPYVAEAMQGGIRMPQHTQTVARRGNVHAGDVRRLARRPTRTRAAVREYLRPETDGSPTMTEATDD